MEWISVKERLPKKKELVLVAILNQYVGAKWKWNIIMSCLTEFNNWSALYGGHSIMIPDYWMPLPEPPYLTEEQKLESEKSSEDGYKERVEWAKKQYEKVINEGYR